MLPSGFHARCRSGLAKWVAQVDDTDRLAEYIGRAFAVATSGRPGPVVLALPENMLSAAADVPDLRATKRLQPVLGADTVQAIMHALAQSERPLIVAGGPHWSAQAQADLQAFAERQQVPVALGFRRQDYMENHHANYAGDLNVWGRYTGDSSDRTKNRKKVSAKKTAKRRGQGLLEKRGL